MRHSRTAAKWLGARKTSLSRLLLAVFERHQRAVRRAGVDLTRTANALLGIFVHLDPVGNPAGEAAHGEEHSEHANRDPEGAVDDTGVEIDVGIELALDEIRIV